MDVVEIRTIALTNSHQVGGETKIKHVICTRCRKLPISNHGIDICHDCFGDLTWEAARLVHPQDRKINLVKND